MDNKDLGRCAVSAAPGCQPSGPQPATPSSQSGIPNAREPWRKFMDCPAWNDGRRIEVLSVVQHGMGIFRDSVASAQRRYEEDCAALADYMAAFVHLSAIIAADAASAFDPASGIEAATADATPKSGAAVGESPAPKGDAQ
jgi:hypothetical protein